ncbi:hypothetical protein HK098_006368 [Nowakowskiella sp. JEL0407]|nr:hypothetical protein HK098_006368 [Nowakowskiella sp. JEL0407]
MKIFCRLGDSCFPVDAEPTTTTVGDLKDAIKEKEHDTFLKSDKLHLVHVFETPSKNEDGGVPSSEFRIYASLSEVERAVLSKRSSGVDVEKVRKTEDGTEVYKVPGWEINGTTISAKVMNPAGNMDIYGLKKSSELFNVDVLVVVPENFRRGHFDAQPMELDASKRDFWSIPSILITDFEDNLKKLLHVSEFEQLKTLSYLTVGNIPIPSFASEKVTLLFWKLGTYDVVNLLQKCLSNQITVILGTSGCGKTRSIFDVLSLVYGLYFTSKEMNTPGATDLNYARLCMEEHFHRDFPKENEEFVDRFVKSLVGARLAVLFFCHSNGVRLTQEEWLIVQLRFDFEPIVKEFRQLEKDDLKKEVNRLVNFARSLNGERNRYIPVFIDEAQLLVSKNDGCFLSSTNQKTKSLYYAFAVAVTKIKSCSFIACGTGLRLSEADAVLLSRTLKPDTDIRHVIGNMFQSHEEINDYLISIFPNLTLSEVESSWLIGRVRLLTSYLENQLMRIYRGHPLMPVRAFIEQVTSRGTELYEYNLKHLFQPDRFSNGILYVQACEILKHCIIHYVYFGDPVVATMEEAWLFENSFGVLRVSILDGFVILVEEPFMLLAIHEFVLGVSVGDVDFYGQTMSVLKTELESRIMHSPEASSQGFLWEKCLAIRLMEICMSDYRILFGNQREKLPEDGVLCNSGSSPLFSTAEKCTFAEFLLNRPTPFYLPDKFAGPDIVFMLELDGKYLPVFVQCKLRNDASCVAGLRTTNPNLFYTNRRTQEVLKLESVKRMAVDDVMREFEMHLGILIVYPKEWKELKVSKEKDGRFEQLFDAKNAHEILDKKHMKMLDCLKKKVGK